MMPMTVQTRAVGELKSWTMERVFADVGHRECKVNLVPHSSVLMLSNIVSNLKPRDHALV